jgi:small subunit ribosomal protein S17
MSDITNTDTPAAETETNAETAQESAEVEPTETAAPVEAVEAPAEPAETTASAESVEAPAEASAPAEDAEAAEPAPAPVEETAAPVAESPVAAAPVAAAPAPAASKGDPDRGRRKLRQGKVVSTKMEKTIIVVIESRVRHPLYGKFMKRSKRFKAHDEQSACGEGDTVEIMETRPLSKEKRWRLVRVIEKAK